MIVLICSEFSENVISYVTVFGIIKKFKTITIQLRLRKRAKKSKVNLGSSKMLPQNKANR